MTLTFTANAGVSLEFRSARIWIDALHDRPVPGFSTLDADKQALLWKHEAFQAPDAIIYTHCHPDHYSSRLTMEAIRRWPNARLILPEPKLLKAEVLQGDEVNKQIGNVSILFVKLTHEGAMYANVPHYGLLLREDDLTILMPGDCELENSKLRMICEDRFISAAILNFPWLTLRKGRNFIKDSIHPKQLLFCHLPFVEDDTEGYCQAVQKSVLELASSDPYKICCLNKFLQRETLE